MEENNKKPLREWSNEELVEHIILLRNSIRLKEKRLDKLLELLEENCKDSGDLGDQISGLFPDPDSDAVEEVQSLRGKSERDPEEIINYIEEMAKKINTGEVERTTESTGDNLQYHDDCETRYVDSNTAYCEDCEKHIPTAHAFDPGDSYDD